MKINSKVLGVGMVKNGCGQSCDGTLKLTVSEEWTDRKTDFLRIDTDSQNLRVDKKFFGWAFQKWMWPVWSRDSKIGCL